MCFILLVVTTHTHAEGSNLPILIIPASSSNDINHEDYYFNQLLALVISKTRAKFGDVLLQEFDGWLVDERLRTALYKNDVDIIWSVTSEHSEQMLLPIKVPLLKDLDHYRVLLIRKNDQARFSRIQSLDDLRMLTGGMGAQWPDADIMKYNGLPLIEATGYGKLFKMLAAKRFDYFSRGLYQVQTEVNFYPDLELQIEDTLLLHYHNAFYFFVNRSNESLARRVEAGLKIAVADGSFDRLFNSIPRYVWAKSQLENKKRKIIELSLPDNKKTL